MKQEDEIEEKFKKNAYRNRVSSVNEAINEPFKGKNMYSH